MTRYTHRVGGCTITVWGNGLAVSIRYPGGSEAFVQDETIAPAIADAIDAGDRRTVLQWLDDLTVIADDPE